ncbi:electron transfer flavoprotein subunit beta/FixA family protein [Clostridium transplantifaecale]|uniref:electron transfer flavoprotein subunit beta/FixA family protein n=1 Tax=Clostridium transplantifaecale TaxID=2479838 RepID=UPI000F640F21|nr:electron transfer flavoprotein subunit beta/FixA family protein [Clostridium transplantifaecale]
MKIAVCIKQVPDTDNVKIDRKTGTLRRSEVPGILNPADLTAIRMAARLKKEAEEKGEETSLTAITMGPPAACEVLREAMARGADKGILLCDRAFAGGDTWATSLVLSEAVKKAGGFSVIFAGKQTTDGETGHVGPQLAEHLKMAQVTGTFQVSLDSGLTVKRIFDGSLETIECRTPAVIVCTGIDGGFQSLPIGRICDAYEKPLTVWGLRELGMTERETGRNGSKTEVRRTFMPESSAKGIMLQGNLDEMARTLAEKLVKGKGSEY